MNASFDLGGVMDPLNRAADFVAQKAAGLEELSGGDKAQMDAEMNSHFLPPVRHLYQTVKKVIHSACRIFSEIGKFFAAIPNVILGFFTKGIKHFTDQYTPADVMEAGVRHGAQAAAECVGVGVNWATEHLNNAARHAQNLANQAAQQARRFQEAQQNQGTESTQAAENEAQAPLGGVVNGIAQDLLGKVAKQFLSGWLMGRGTEAATGAEQTPSATQVPASTPDILDLD